MDVETFATNCAHLGYCLRGFALTYAKKTGRTVFTEDDYIEVYRKAQERDNAQENYGSKYHAYQGAMCTKRFTGSERGESEYD